MTIYPLLSFIRKERKQNEKISKQQKKKASIKSTLPEVSTLTKNIQAALTAAQRNVLSAETAVR